MFDVEDEAGESYGVQISPDDPRRLQAGTIPNQSGQICTLIVSLNFVAHSLSDILASC